MADFNAEKSFIIDDNRTFHRKSLDEKSPLVRSTNSVSSVLGTSLVFSGKELRRNLGFRHAFVFVVGILFGSGIFISPGLVAKESANMGMAIIVWIVSGIPCLFGALCFCELSCMYGKTGGEYIYMFEAYGKVMGFLCVWAQSIAIVPIGMAITAVAIGEHIVEPFYDIKSTSRIWITKAVALFAMLISMVINCVSNSFVGKLQIWFTIIQTLSVCFLVILGIWQVSIGHIQNYVTMFDNSSNFDIGSFGLALYNGLWGYEGWGMVVSISEELENLETNLWLSIVTGIPFVIFCYVLINLSLMAALTRDQMANSATVATTFVENILGKKVALIIPFAVAFSCFGSINACLFLLARMLLSAAREGQLPYVLCFIHKQRRTPIPAAVAFFIISAIWIVIPGIDMQSLIALFSFAIWSQYGLVIFSVVVMRIRHPEVPRPFKVWWINPIFTSLIALFLIIIPFVKRPVESSICLVILLSALPVYYVFIKKHDSLPSCLLKVMDKFNGFLMAKCNLVPCVFVEKENLNGEANHNEL